MTSSSTPYSGHPDSYRPIPGRMVTQRWKDANKVDYGGDDWGDDDYAEAGPQAAQGQRGHGWGPSTSQQSYQNAPSQYNPSERTGTMRSAGGQSFGHSSQGRQSFDQGDERRNFSSSIVQEGPYPTAPRLQQFEDIDPRDYEPRLNSLRGPYQDYEPRQNSLRGPPPLHVQTNERPSSRERGPYSAGYYPPDPRMNQHPDARAGPFSAAMAHSGQRQRSESGSRPLHAEMFGRYESPARPGSRGSQSSSPARQQLPPRKSSLSQQNAPPEIFASAPLEPDSTEALPSNPAADAKPLPFLRPIDIWKRHEEEQSERRSQESSRPSFDSSNSKNRAGSAVGNTMSTQPSENPSVLPDAIRTPGETDETTLVDAPLDRVEEPKSERGVDEVLTEATPRETRAVPPVAALARQESDLASPASETSNYSNRPDPVSNASLYSTPSVREREPPHRQISTHSLITRPHILPEVRAMSGFGNDFFDRNSVSRPNQTPDPGAASPVPARDAPTVPMKEEPALSGEGRTIASAPSTAPQTGLQHNTSHGYRSMVDQAFDESQRELPTPISATETYPRSNSASTLDISPVVSRSAGQQVPSMTTSRPPIPEESFEIPTYAGRQPTTASFVEQQAPVPFKPGYRRDTSTPSPDNSPARRPANMTASDVPHAKLGNMSSTMQDPNAGNLYQAPLNPSISVNKDQDHDDEVPRLDRPPFLRDQPSPDARSASTEYKEWQEQRKQFNAKMGIQTETPSTPGIPSPISRTESPAKGTVREIAGKLEDRPRRSSPALTEISRPMQNRLESFRPSIPGGWQSYTTNNSQLEPRTISPEPVRLMRPETPVRTDTSESQIPRAGPPRDRDQDITRASAFAAAAAAGSALAGAFGGPGPSKVQKIPSTDYEQSDDDSEDTRAMPREELDVPETRGSTVATPASLLPPPPLPKDTPRDFESTVDYFPAPLNTKRSNETRAAGRPSLQPNLIHNMSPNEGNDERLQQEIEQSLTPRSSRYAPEAADHLRKHSMSQQDDPAEDAPGAFPEESTMAEKDDPLWKENGPLAADEVSRENSIRGVSALPATTEPKQGLLEQRFSWETQQQQYSATQSISPSNSKSVTIPKAYEHSANDARSLATTRASDRAVSPVDTEITPPNRVTETSAAAAALGATSVLNAHSDDSPSTVTDGQMPGALLNSDRDARGFNGLSSSTVMNSKPPFMDNSASVLTGSKPETREIPFREILNMNNHDEKMRAYSANRQHFSVSDGKLEQWMQAMGQQSPDNANLLASNGKLSQDQVEALQTYRPSPSKANISRLTSGTFSSPGTGGSGTKQIQENSKRLVTSAGKYSARLLAKGKDKLRTASAGDKGNRRRSSGPMPGAFPEEETQHSTTTFSAPPQIPEQDLNISPVDDDSWSLPYGKTEGMKANDQSTTAGPPVPGHQAQLSGFTTLDSSHQSSHLAPSSLPGTSSALAPAPSPKVSIISRTSDDDVPSRSVSEVTRSGEDQSLVGKNSREDLGQSNAVSARDAVAAGAVGLGAVGATAAALAERERRHDSETSSGLRTPQALENKTLSTPTTTSAGMQEQFEGEENNRRITRGPELAQTEELAAPADKRDSSVSNVSSLDQGSTMPGDTTRSVPSALISHPPTMKTGSPLYNQITPKETESLERQENHDSGSAPANSLQSTPSRFGHYDEVIPITDLSARRLEQDQSTQPRPFSFAAPNVLMEPVQRNADKLISSAATKPTVSAGEPLNKEWSNVSVDEVPKDTSDLGKRTSKSYSRPFGAEPNVDDHPAFRSSPTPDTSRMYSSGSPLPSARRESPLPSANRENPLPSARRESPLPSANRPPEELNRNRPENVQQSRPVEQYRIPGPYGQEYRSPKQPPQGYEQRQWPSNQQQQQQYNQQVPSQNQQQQHSQQGPPQSQQQYNQQATSQKEQSYQQPQQPDQRQGMTPPERPKNTIMGGLFGNRSKSKMRDDREDSLSQSNDDGRGKRNSIFKTKSRQDSVSSSQRSQSLRGESRDQVSQLPHWSANPDPVNGPNSRKSKDMSRSSTFGNTNQEPSKKKRHSGFGSLFSRAPKSAPPQRSSTTQSNSGKPSKLGALQQEIYNQQVSPSQRNNAGPGRQSPENFRGNPPPAAGYHGQVGSYEDQGRGQQHPASAFPRGQAGSYEGPGRGQQHPASAFPRGQAGLYEDQGRGQQHPASAFPHGPDSVGGQYPPSQQARYPQNDPRSQSYQSNAMPSYQQHHPDQQNLDQRPSNLRINTGASQGERSTVPSTAPPIPAPASYHQQSYANPAIYNYDRPQVQSQLSQQSHEEPQGQAQSAQPSYHQSQGQSRSAYPSYNDTERQVQSSKPLYPITTAPSASTSSTVADRARSPAVSSQAHAVDLHRRSRSPRHGRHPSEDDLQTQSDPASQLGTFKNRSPAAGISKEQEVQEKPWRIDLPEAEEREREAKRRSKQALIERSSLGSPTSASESATRSPTAGQGSGQGAGAGQQETRPLTVAEKIMGAQPERAPLSPSTAAAVNTSSAGRDVRSGVVAGARGKEFPVAELPGSKAEGYESDEEIPMSATAYPGQEWMPFGAQEMGYGKWDD